MLSEVPDPLGWVHDLGLGYQVDAPFVSCFNPGISDDFPTTDCDCNVNNIRDKCDIENGTSQDNNDNGIPDECEP